MTYYPPSQANILRTILDVGGKPLYITRKENNKD